MTIDAGVFNINRANQAMEIAAAAYLQDEELVRGIFKFADKVEFLTNKNTDTQVLLVEYEDMAFCAFRGTQFSENWSTIDVLRNTKFRKTSWGMSADAGIRAHRGYAKAVDSVLGGLFYWVDTMRARGKKVICTGHSMGGVEASGMSLLVDFDATYTFGAPRFGNKAFAQALEGRHVFRVVHESDIAPSYPHKLLGYRHAGQRWQLSREGGYAQIDGARKDFWHYPYLTGKKDHKPANYLKATKKGHFK